MKILCLFVRHGTERYPEALTLLDEWYARHGLLDQRTLWIIDNARDITLTPETVGPRVYLRSGDNHSWEFSAWSQAIRQLREEGATFDAVHFVTSAFNSLYTEYLRHFEPRMLEYTLAKKACLGHIDSYPKPIQLGNIVSQSWIRTCFFFLPWESVFSVFPWVAFPDGDQFFESRVSRQFRSDAPLSTDYQGHITAWLEGQEMGGHTWHSPMSHGLQENIRFQQKAIAILNEHHLAITLRASGIKLIDFCWLYSLRTTLLPLAVDPPAELEQLKIRRKILGIPE